MGIVVGLASRASLFLILVLSLQIIGFSWMQTLLITAIALLLPMVNPSRVLARASIGLILIWSLAIALGAAPTYPDLSQGFKSLATLEVQQVIQNGIPKVQSGIAEMVSTGFRKPEKDPEATRQNYSRQLPGDYAEQLHAIDLLEKSGALQQTDAVRLKKDINDKARAHLLRQAENYH